MMTEPRTECQKPGCIEDPRETYTDPNGNDLEVCGEHYWELVAGTPVVRTIRAPRERNEPRSFLHRLFPGMAEESDKR